MRSLSRILIVTVTLLGCVGCDQASKSIARALLPAGASAAFLHDALHLQLVENSGSFLSLGASLPEQFRWLLFVGATGALLILLISMALFVKRLTPWQFVTLGLVAGGGLSNLLDRLIDQGRVTDFINIRLGPLRTGIFNVADMAILAGALLLLLRPRSAGSAKELATPPAAK